MTETESCLTRVITIIALTCFLVVGAAAASILGRDSVPAAWSGMSASLSPAMNNPVSNREGKKDKLAVGRFALASFEPQQAWIPAQIQDQAAPANPGDQLRMAFASTAPADIEAPKLATPGTTAQAKPKLVAKPQPPVQKSYALLSDVQIAGIKERLKLSADQESYWPAVESALRAIARKIHATRKADPNATGAPIDPDAEEVQQLKSAAMPLLFQLREDQKREVRTLARIIGLERVASMI
ncbi:MAG: hypothetical protein JWR80_6915 [Bradyrhizobium sp.]|nr:hypothetical protein [Bradyrhizobium sp.]